MHRVGIEAACGAPAAMLVASCGCPCCPAGKAHHQHTLCVRLASERKPLPMCNVKTVCVGDDIKTYTWLQACSCVEPNRRTLN
jgi:hypothetical protein